MGVSLKELEFVRTYLDSLQERVDAGRIEMAREVVKTWELR